MKRTLSFIIGALLVIIGCFGSLGGAATTILVLLGIACIFFGLTWSDTVHPSLIAQAKNVTKDFITYDEETKTLFLKKRDANISKIIRLTSDVNYSLGYKPEELHYGSVTVGGVTTGGVYKTGGYHYAVGRKSGYYVLTYANMPIMEIRFEPEMLDEIKKSSVSEYLDKEESYLRAGITSRDKLKKLLDWMILKGN